MSALPTGDSLESLPDLMSASAEPTIVYGDDLPFSSRTWTVVPMRTTSLESSVASTTCAERRRSSSWAIRVSSIACSFLASSYSEFSEMSPNSRASLMRSATSRRFVVCSSSSSALSRSRPSGVRITSFGMRARQYSRVSSGGCEGDLSPIERRQDRPGLRRRRRLLQRRLGRLALAQHRQVPGVELAQVASGAVLAEGLDGAVHDPVQLREHLLARGRAVARPEDLLEEPRVAQRAACEHDRGDAGLREGAADVRGVAHAAREDDRYQQLGGQPRRELVVGRALVVDLGRARVETDRADAGLLDEAVGE